MRCRQSRSAFFDKVGVRQGSGAKRPRRTVAASRSSSPPHSGPHESDLPGPPSAGCGPCDARASNVRCLARWPPAVHPVPETKGRVDPSALVHMDLHFAMVIVASVAHVHEAPLLRAGDAFHLRKGRFQGMTFIKIAMNPLFFKIISAFFEWPFHCSLKRIYRQAAFGSGDGLAVSRSGQFSHTHSIGSQLRAVPLHR